MMVMSNGDFVDSTDVPGPGGRKADGEEGEDGAVLQHTQLDMAKVGGGQTELYWFWGR